MSLRSGGDPDSQIIEEFWGVELTKDKKIAKWEAEEEEDDSLLISNNLEIRQACLGIGAKEGERNVVQVSVEDDSGKTSNFTIVSLRLGSTEQCTLFLNLQPPITFKLVQGSGPVCLVGQTTETMNNFPGGSSDESDEIEELPKESLLLNLKKRPAPSMLKRQAKVNKRDPDVSFSKSGTDDLDDLDDDDDEEDYDVEDDMDDDDDVMEDSDDADEVSDEEEEEEEEVKPISKKAQINGKSKALVKGGKMVAVSTPLMKNAAKWKTSAPKKTMGDKKKKPSSEGPDIEKIKESLSKMSVPKKLNKFNNFLSSSFKVKDDNVKKQLWEHVQKSRPQK